MTDKQKEVYKMKKLAKKLGLNVSGSFEQLEKRIAKKLARKLCNCEKQVLKDVKDISRAIAICTDSVIHRRGLRTHGFRCGKSITTKVVNGRPTKSLRRYAHLVKLPFSSEKPMKDRLWWFDNMARSEYKRGKTRKNRGNRGNRKTRKN